MVWVFFDAVFYNSNLAEGLKIISDSVSEVNDVLNTQNKKTTVLIVELTASTVNFKILFWIDTFKSTSKTYHNNIRSAVIDKVVENLLKNGFYLPSTIVEIKKYKP